MHTRRKLPNGTDWHCYVNAFLRKDFSSYDTSWHFLFTPSERQCWVPSVKSKNWKCVGTRQHYITRDGDGTGTSADSTNRYIGSSKFSGIFPLFLNLWILIQQAGREDDEDDQKWRWNASNSKKMGGTVDEIKHRLIEAERRMQELSAKRSSWLIEHCPNRQ